MSADRADSIAANPIVELGRVGESMPALAVSLDAEGRLSVAAADRPLGFRCRCLGFEFEGRFDGSADAKALELATVISLLPFSIELPNLRQQMLRLIRASETLQHARLVRLPDGRIAAGGKLPIEPPISQPRLIGAATVIILELMPYLALATELLAPLAGRPSAA